MNDDLGYWLALTRFRKFGAMRFKKLTVSFPTMQEAFCAGRNELIRAEIEPALADEFLVARESIDPQKELALLAEHDAHAVTVNDPAYPPLLKSIYDPPPVLFIRGTLPDSQRPHLAVVGSRHPSSYGQTVVRDLIEPLAESGVVIVSGLAYGIDALAHRAAIEKRGATIAVLGAGLDHDNIYPTQHRALASSIVAAGGALVSEFPIGTHALKQHFPFRNRVIAGLCRATLVIEAAAKSGSLITARSALESGREVLAVPGSIHSSLSEGPNNLIKMGATPVTAIDDILQSFGLVKPNAKPQDAYVPGSREEKTLRDLLSQDPLHIDELVDRSALPAKTVTATLTLMEMKSAARHIGGMYYVRR